MLLYSNNVRWIEIGYYRNTRAISMQQKWTALAPSETKGEISFIHIRGIWYTRHAALPTGSRDGNVEAGVGAKCKAPTGQQLCIHRGEGL